MTFKTENKLTSWHIGIALAALFVGGAFGPLQKAEHVGINLYPALSDVGIKSYYQGLTLHGVLNALVWTTFFITGFFVFAVTRSLNRELRYPKLNVAALIVMALGLVMAAVPLLGNKASVLYTFYPR